MKAMTSRGPTLRAAGGPLAAVVALVGISVLRFVFPDAQGIMLFASFRSLCSGSCAASAPGWWQRFWHLAPGRCLWTIFRNGSRLMRVSRALDRRPQGSWAIR